MTNRTAEPVTGLAEWARLHGRALTALFFALLVLLGLFAVQHAAPGADDGTERRVLGLNIRAYAELFGLENTPFCAGLPEGDIASHVERDHGQARLYPVWPVMAALRQAGRLGAASTALYYYNHLLFLLGLFGVYAVLFRLTGSRGAGLVTVLLLYLNPRFFAESFYNTKDLTLLSLCLVGFWLGHAGLLARRSGSGQLCGVLVSADPGGLGRPGRLFALSAGRDQQF